jgi:hypothetical protein
VSSGPSLTAIGARLVTGAAMGPVPASLLLAGGRVGRAPFSGVAVSPLVAIGRCVMGSRPTAAALSGREAEGPFAKGRSRALALLSRAFATEASSLIGTGPPGLHQTVDQGRKRTVQTATWKH